MKTGIILVAYKLFTETSEDGLENWPSHSFEIDSSEQGDYADAGFLVNYPYIFEEYKESMADAYRAWELEYHPTPRPVKIHQFIRAKSNITEPPVDVDYVSGLMIKLHRKATLVKGECVKEEFYANYDGEMYSNLIVKEESVFTRDALGFPIFKDVTISWANEDDAFHKTTKTWRKYYSSLEKISEGKIRRGNLFNSLQMPMIGLISLAMLETNVPSPEVILEGRKFLAAYKNQFETFIADSNKEIILCLDQADHPNYIDSEVWPWIDYTTPYGITIRQFLLSELSI